MEAVTVTAADEQALLDRLRAGDAFALEALMERFAPRLFRLVRGITGNEADAEEVVQDVFLTLFKKVETFEGRAALGTWLYRVATNAALNRRRGKQASMTVSLDACLPTFLADGHREASRDFLLADWSQMPEEALLSGESRQVVRDILDALPDHYRAVLLLRDMEELPNEDVAAMLGESVGSVKSRLHRARMAARELITRTLTDR